MVCHSVKLDGPDRVGTKINFPTWGLTSLLTWRPDWIRNFRINSRSTLFSASTHAAFICAFTFTVCPPPSICTTVVQMLTKLVGDCVREPRPVVFSPCWENFQLIGAVIRTRISKLPVAKALVRTSFFELVWPTTVGNMVVGSFTTKQEQRRF